MSVPKESYYTRISSASHLTNVASRKRPYDPMIIFKGAGRQPLNFLQNIPYALFFWGAGPGKSRMRECLQCSATFSSDNGWQCPSCSARPLVRNTIPFFAPELAESNDGFPDEFERLYRLEANNFLFRARNKL